MSENTSENTLKNVLLANEYEKVKTKKPVDQYWASEKFDGYRAIWDGEKFVSRNGKEFTAAPQWFKDSMPSGVVLDGELWTKRDDFNTCGIFRKKTPVEGEWEKHDVKYKVFDIPLVAKPFESRMKELAKRIRLQKKVVKAFKNPVPYFPLSLTKQIKVKNNEHLKIKIFK